jgi:integrase
MKRNETESILVDKSPPRKQKNTFARVYDRDGRRVRGLWVRNGVYYAQVRVGRHKTRVRLEHADTVPQAVTELQALKKRRRAGKLTLPQKLPVQKGAQNPEQEGEHKVGSHRSPLKDAIAGYQRDRDTLDKKDPDTGRREDSGLKLWVKAFGEHQIGKADAKLLKDYAIWRKLDAKARDRNCSGRTIDLDIMAFSHVIDWAITEKWLPEDFKKPNWTPMADPPSKDRLLSPEELEQLCQAALLDPKALELLDPRVRHLRAAQEITGRSFADYMRLMAYSGGREQETLQLRWQNVHWKQGVLHFPGASQGGKRGGGSNQAGQPRDLEFFGKLEAHLKAMHERRDPSSDCLFPTSRGEGPTKSFRKQLLRVRKATDIKDVTFQYFRHYYISHCVMAGVDYMTIAKWAGHLDGGVLIGKVYGHLSREHPRQMAKKLDAAF